MRLFPGLKFFHVVFPPQHFRGGYKQETLERLKNQVIKPVVPVANDADNKVISGLGFCGQCEDEKNREKISSLDFSFFLSRKRTSNN